MPWFIKPCDVQRQLLPSDTPILSTSRAASYQTAKWLKAHGTDPQGRFDFILDINVQTYGVALQRAVLDDICRDLSREEEDTSFFEDVVAEPMNWRPPDRPSLQLPILILGPVFFLVLRDRLRAVWQEYDRRHLCWKAFRLTCEEFGYDEPWFLDMDSIYRSIGTPPGSATGAD